MAEFLIGLYIFVCIMWGIFATKMQKAVYPHNSSRSSLLCNFLVNAMICPLSMISALIKFNFYIGKIRENAK